MTERLITLLLRLSSRERRLLALLALVVTPVLVWLALITPLLDSRAAAQQQAVETRALADWLLARADEQALLGQSAPTQRQPVPERAPIGISGLEQSLVLAGLRPAVTALAAATEGGVELQFDQVEFTALAAWLSQSQPSWGYEIQSFRLQPVTASEGGFGVQPDPTAEAAADTAGMISAALTLTPAMQ